MRTKKAKKPTRVKRIYTKRAATWAENRVIEPEVLQNPLNEALPSLPPVSEVFLKEPNPSTGEAQIPVVVKMTFPCRNKKFHYGILNGEKIAVSINALRGNPAKKDVIVQKKVIDGAVFYYAQKFTYSV